jgi:two-component system KDP operon response regulator KdpE
VRQNILVVEDYPEISDAISFCLQLRIDGTVPTVVMKGIKAIEMAKTEQYDLIILDKNLPDIDGIEVLRLIRRFSGVPVLIESFRHSENDKLKWSEFGANDYITKPFKISELIDKASALLKQGKGTAADAK